MKAKGNCAVVGAGIIGITAALALVEAGFGVDLYTDKLPSATTSMVAAGLWHPYKAYPEDRVAEWARKTFTVFAEHAALDETGVRFQPIKEFFTTPPQLPPWLDIVEGFHWLPSEALPYSYTHGFSFMTPVADTSTYLPWLWHKLIEQGVAVYQRKLGTLEELGEQYAFVANCAGLGARELVGDETLFPIRGQIKRTQPLPHGEDCIYLFDSDGLSYYVIPRNEDCVLGGTAEEHEWSLTPEADTARLIRQHCETMVPDLTQLADVDDVVGLRPGRAEVRLGLDKTKNGIPVIHNYGHGGSGITLCWGCAEELVALAHTLF